MLEKTQVRESLKMGSMSSSSENVCACACLQSLFHEMCLCLFWFWSFPLLWVGFTEGFQLVKVNREEIKALCIFAKVTLISSSGKTSRQGHGNHPMTEPWLWVYFLKTLLLQFEIQFVHDSNPAHLFPSWCLAAAYWHSAFQMPKLQEAV